MASVQASSFYMSETSWKVLVFVTVPFSHSQPVLTFKLKLCEELFPSNPVRSSAAVINPWLFFFFFLDFNCWTQNCLSDQGALHQRRLYRRISAEGDESHFPSSLVLHLIFRGAERTTRSPVFLVTLPVLPPFPGSGMRKAMLDSSWFFGAGPEGKEHRWVCPLPTYQFFPPRSWKEILYY